MQLSIIVPNIKTSIELENTLENFRTQNTQDFELILVITNINKTMYSLLEEGLKFFGSRLKFILNSNRKSIQNNIVSGFHLVKGKYVTIIYTDNKLKDHYVEDLVNLSSKYDTDVIEYRPRLINTIRWKPEPRIKPLHVYNILNEPEYVAYAYPFIFNKIFKNSLIQQFIKFKQKELNDTKFAVELTYMLLLKSTSYVYENIRIIKENISSSLWLTPKNFIYQFNEIINYVEINNIKLSHEINYANLYFLQLFLAGLLKTWRRRFSLNVFKDITNYNEKRSTKFTEDLYKYLEKFHKDNLLFFTTNIYMLKNNSETKSLKKLPPINKWNDILGEL
ncbi:Glycosyl transferase family 2 [Mycoplasmopsis maculosa]|uniref:Glycosyl transferase family 2 n=1 Tax=Mycoplasmopsis maculosa TaxID=114885 RepID=A0A449B3L3_9BACT|nr:glycosyltransferase [Mycoplasmopsis maculosa]VEU75191.1 Glycosyl transferase family 2 [Mycoplasmopsis maculosa]